MPKKGYKWQRDDDLTCDNDGLVEIVNRQVAG